MPSNEQGRSSQPDKQRKAQAQAPQHRRREMMSAHLSEDLLVKYDRRSMPLRTGDQVEIMRGDFAGETGEVLEIDYDAQEIEVDGAVNRSADGSQVPRPIHPSNVRITQLDLTDPRRRAKLERKGVEVEEPEPEPEPEEAADEEVEPEAEEPSTPAASDEAPTTDTETAPEEASPATEADEPETEGTEGTEEADEPADSDEGDEAPEAEDAEATADADDDNETTQEGSS